MGSYNYNDVMEDLHEIMMSKPEGGDFVYRGGALPGGPTCFYAKDGKPDCIVGHLLHKYGVSIEDMTWTSTISNGKYSTEHIVDHFKRLTEDDGIEFSEKAKRALSIIQNRQDLGHTWFEAIEAARYALRDEPDVVFI